MVSSRTDLIPEGADFVNGNFRHNRRTGTCGDCVPAGMPCQENARDVWPADMVIRRSPVWVRNSLDLRENGQNRALLA